MTPYKLKPLPLLTRTFEILAIHRRTRFEDQQQSAASALVLPAVALHVVAEYASVDSGVAAARFVVVVVVVVASAAVAVVVVVVEHIH